MSLDHPPLLCSQLQHTCHALQSACKQAASPSDPQLPFEEDLGEALNAFIPTHPEARFRCPVNSCTQACRVYDILHILLVLSCHMSTLRPQSPSVQVSHQRLIKATACMHKHHCWRGVLLKQQNRHTRPYMTDGKKPLGHMHACKP